MSSAVIAQSAAPPKPANLPSEQKIEQIALEQILPSKSNPRTTYDPDAILGLAESIKAQGLIQAIVVRPRTFTVADAADKLPHAPVAIGEKCFEIVCGHRRWLAVKQLGLKSIPAVVRDLSDREVTEMQLVENDQREGVKAIEQGRAYKAHLDQLAKEQPKAVREDLIKQIGNRIGKSVRHVYSRMKLTELIPELQNDLAAGWISNSHADELVRLCAKDQKEFADCHLYHNGNEEFTRGGDGPKFANSVRFVKDKIAKEYQLDLTKPPFPAEDVNLVPSAGPCGSCINNSINSPLFEGDAGKKATCMDRACFAKKREAFIAIEAAKQKPVAAKPEILRVTPLHELPYSRRKEKDQPKTRKEWKTAHKGECPNVQPAVVVDSSGLHDQAVGAKLVCANTKCDVHFGDKPEKAKTTAGLSGHRSAASPKETEAEREQRRQEGLQDKADLAGDVALVKAVLKNVNGIGVTEIGLLFDQVGKFSEIGYDGLALIAEIFAWPKCKNRYNQLEDWWKEYSAKFSALDAAKFLIACLIAESVGGDDYSNFERADLDKFAARYKLDAKVIRKQAADAVLKPVQTSAAPAVVKPKAGVCRICGCTAAHACVLGHGKKGKGKGKPITCKWADSTKTLCSNPDCMKKAGAEAKAAVKSVVKPTAKKAAKKGGR
jgi:ParB/RepB/Spo0J family partition protein